MSGILGVWVAILFGSSFYANASVSSAAITPEQSGSEKALITLNNVQKFADFVNGCMTQIRLGNIEFLKICTAVIERMNIELAKFNVDNSAELESKFVDVPFFVGSLAEQDSSTVTGTTDLLALKADSRFGTELLKQLPNIVVACGTAYDMVTTCPVLLNSLYDHVQRATELNQHDYDTMGANANNGLDSEPSLGENTDSKLGFGNKTSPSANGTSDALQLQKYENPLMGIRFDYPSDWNFTIWSGFEEAFCNGVDIDCRLALNPNYKLSSYPDVVGFDISASRGPTFAKECNCSSLIEYVRWHYNHIQNNTLFFFDKDNKTVVGGKIPAWQIEYEIDWLGKTQHVLDTLVISDGTYYVINYYADPISFPKFFPVVKEMINSLQFIPIRQISGAEIPPYVQDFSPKKPSFIEP